MKRLAYRLVFAPAVALIVFASVSAFAGSLTPPGVPGPTMKTLDQVEPRIPIKQSDLPLNISQPGSYYFAENLTFSTVDADAITVEASNVSIDLSGFTLTGPGQTAGSTGSGIVSGISGPKGLSVMNGRITQFRGTGVVAGPLSIVTGITVTHMGSCGIFANSGSLIKGNVCSDISKPDGSMAIGIDLRGRECQAVGNICSNIEATGTDMSAYGIRDFAGSSIIRENTCRTITGSGSGTAAGIIISGGSRVEGNICAEVSGTSGKNYGIYIGGSRVTVISNSCYGTTNESICFGPSAIGGFASDNLTPDGALDNGKNSLDVIISQLPFTISSPGTYRLKGTVRLATTDTDGITIACDNVVLDLGGNALVGPGKAAGTTGTGIQVGTTLRQNLVVKNGTIRDWRNSGIYGAFASKARFEKLQVFDNGNTGLIAGIHCIVSECLASHNGIHGIEANYRCRIQDNVADSNAQVGIIIAGPDNQIERNLVLGNAEGINVNAATGNYIAGNRARANTSANYNIAGGNTQGTGDLANVSF